MHNATTTASVSLKSTQRPTRVRYLILVLVALASSSAYLTRHCIAVANTAIQEDLGLTDKQMGWILGAFAGGYLFFQIPGGWLGNTFGTRKALSGISILWSGLTMATAASTSFFHLFATRFVFGSAQAGLVPNSAKVLKDWIPLRRRGISSALIGASMSLGGAITMYLTGKLIGQMHWRVIFHLYSFVGIVWAIGFYWCFRTRPEEHSWVNSQEVAIIRADPTSSKDGSSEAGTETLTASIAEDPSPPLSRLLAEMFRHRTTWAICAQSFFRAAGYAFYVTWLPAFLTYRFGVTKETAGTMTTWPLLSVIPGSIAGGILVDYILRRTGNRWISRSGIACATLIVCGFLTLAAAHASSVEQLVGLMALGALFSGLAGPATWSAMIDIAGKRTPVVVAVMNTAGCLTWFVTIYLGYLIQGIKESGGDWNQVIYLHVAFYFGAAFFFLFVNPNDNVTAGAELPTTSD